MRHDSHESRRARSRERILKTVGVLPSLATLGNLTCGLGAIYLCMLAAQAAASPAAGNGTEPTKVIALFSTYLSAAACFLILGMFFDAIDGRLARLARKTSEFGAQLDSLADIVSFGVAPACLVLMIAKPAIFSEMVDLTRLERAYWRAEWVMAAIYVCCTAMRLARFNVENEEDESAHMDFRGLPSPGAAGAIIAAVLLHEHLLPAIIHAKTIVIIERLMPPFALVLGLLMVSPFRYPHMVNAILRGRRPFWQVVS
ncbi:MAG: CDP-alcohol phosphatidyltransferase family protein, partial [Phycisphaerales bacterium]|nr:CDP-alcohol phosphatidyltransferase family protein [Phycisphaerales bacterium]